MQLTNTQRHDAKHLFKSLAADNVADIFDVDMNGNAYCIKTAIIDTGENLRLIAFADYQIIEWPESWELYDRITAYTDLDMAYYNWRDHLPNGHQEAF